MLFISDKTEDKVLANEVLRRALDHGCSDEQIFHDSDPGSPKSSLARPSTTTNPSTMPPYNPASSPPAPTT